MPIRKHDPFKDPLEGLSSAVNPYLELLREGSKGALPLLYGPALAPYPGRWREHLSQAMGHVPEELILEIGSHLGEVILQMAADHPQRAFLGLDITFKRVVKMAQKARHLTKSNLTSILANAQGLEQLFAARELDGVIIFFPDPWAKKQRQTKNRLINAQFLTTLANKMTSEGWFWFKTDCEPYFSEVLAHAKALGWREESIGTSLPTQTYTSRFERHFRDLGLATYESVLRPPQDPRTPPSFPSVKINS